MQKSIKIEKNIKKERSARLIALGEELTAKRLLRALETPVRPVLFDYRHYNQDMTTGSLLVEIGTHGSTLGQAKNSRQAFAVSLAAMLDNI